MLSTPRSRGLPGAIVAQVARAGGWRLEDTSTSMVHYREITLVIDDSM